MKRKGWKKNRGRKELGKAGKQKKKWRGKKGRGKKRKEKQGKEKRKEKVGLKLLVPFFSALKVSLVQSQNWQVATEGIGG